jgi:hypothetical protein
MAGRSVVLARFFLTLGANRSSYQMSTGNSRTNHYLLSVGDFKYLGTVELEALEYYTNCDFTGILCEIIF